MDCWGTIIDYHEPLRLSPERTSATGVETADLRDVDSVFRALATRLRNECIYLFRFIY